MRGHLRTALATIDAATLRTGAAFALLHLVERLAVVGSTAAFVRGGGATAIVAVVGVAAVVGVRALFRGGFRGAVQASLHRRVVESLLHGDLFRASPLDDDDAEAAILDGLEAAERLVTDAAPSLVADAIAAVVLAAFLAAVEPARVLGVGAVALVLAAGGLVFVRGVTFREVDRAWRAYRPVIDRLVGAIGGRLEIVGNGGRAAYLTALDADLRAWRRASIRAERLMAVAARLPAIIAACAVGIALVADSALRGEVTLRAFGDAAIFVAALPAFAGVVRSSTELFKGTAAIAPIAPMLTAAPVPPPIAREASDAVAPDAVRFRGVGFEYPGAARAALAAIDVEWRPGQVLVLRGANGSGKSTLLRIVLGVAPGYEGEIVVGDREGARELRAIDADAWRARIGYLPQRPYLMDRASIREALLWPSPKVDDAVLRAALERVRLWGVLSEKRPASPLDVRVGALSVGERQRLAVARLVARDRPVLLLDEPDANLDAAGIRDVAAMVRDLARTRMVMVAAHTKELVAAGDVVVTLERGRVVAGEPISADRSSDSPP